METPGAGCEPLFELWSARLWWLIRQPSSTIHWSEKSVISKRSWYGCWRVEFIIKTGVETSSDLDPSRLALTVCGIALHSIPVALARRRIVPTTIWSDKHDAYNNSWIHFSKECWTSLESKSSRWRHSSLLKLSLEKSYFCWWEIQSPNN